MVSRLDTMLLRPGIAAKTQLDSFSTRQADLLRAHLQIQIYCSSLIRAIANGKGEQPCSASKAACIPDGSYKAATNAASRHKR